MLQKSNSLQGDPLRFAPSGGNEHFKAQTETGNPHSHQRRIHRQSNIHLTQEEKTTKRKKLLNSSIYLIGKYTHRKEKYKNTVPTCNYSLPAFINGNKKSISTHMLE